MANNGVSRRHFFFGTILAGAVPPGGFGSVPSLRALGYKPYYDKLNVAAIGCGGQGGVILNEAARTENIVAVCDVDEARAAQNLQRFDSRPSIKTSASCWIKMVRTSTPAPSASQTTCTPRWPTPACSAANASMWRSRSPEL